MADQEKDPGHGLGCRVLLPVSVREYVSPDNVFGQSCSCANNMNPNNYLGTVFAPSVHVVMSDLGVTDSTLGAFLVSVFLFAYAVGPLFLAPLSERYGRSIILHVGNSVFVVFSIGAGFSQTVSLSLGSLNR